MKQLLALLPFLLPVTLVNAQSLVFSSGGGSLSLTISSATAGSEPDEVTDNSTELTWDSEGAATAKLTISTSCPGQSFGLYAELSVTTWGAGTTGTEQGEITLSDGMLDTDLFRDIPTTLPARQGSGTLTYRATATVAQGNSADNGDDLHVITLTIAAQ